MSFSIVQTSLMGREMHFVLHLKRGHPVRIRERRKELPIMD